jgi:hypothetical protein
MKKVAALLSLLLTVAALLAPAEARFRAGRVSNLVASTIAPQSGGSAGGTTVTVTGSGLTFATGVNFGVTNVACPGASCSVNSDSRLTVVAPAHSTGLVNVQVTSAAGSSTVATQFNYSDATHSFVAGTTDPNGHYIGGTEVRDGNWVPFYNTQVLPDGTTCSQSTCWVLFIFTGFWEDNACNGGSSQGPQAIALTSTFGSWYRDFEFTGTGSCGGGSFNVANSSQLAYGDFDGDGNAISPPTPLMLVGGTTKAVYLRNNAANSWSSYTFTGGGGVARAIGNHKRTTGGKSVRNIKVGNDNDGVHEAVFCTQSATGAVCSTGPGFGLIITATSDNWCQAWSGSTCTSTCSPNNASNCTQQNQDWPYNLSLTSYSHASGVMTVRWSSASALQAVPSPGAQVIVSGITGFTGTNPNGTFTITAGTTTSVSYATATTNCGGCTGGTITSPTNPQEVQLNWSPAFASAPTGSVTVSGITGYVGTNPNGTFTIDNANNTTTSLSYVTATNTLLTNGTDCSNCNVSGALFSVTGHSNVAPNNAVNGCPYGGDPQAGSVIGCTLPNIRVVGITDCPVSNTGVSALGANSDGVASFAATGNQVWVGVDSGTTTKMKLVGEVPPTAGGNGASFNSGQPQIRGESCIVDNPITGHYSLIFHIEGDGNVWLMDPDTGVFTAEADFVALLTAQWGSQGGHGYGIDFYNSEGVYPITVDGTAYYIGGEGDASVTPSNRPYETSGPLAAKWNEASGFWIRSTDPTTGAPTWTVYPTSSGMDTVLSAITTSTTPTTPATATCTNINGSGPPCKSMISTRVGPLQSMFASDLDGNGVGTVLFMCGTDRNATGNHDTAWCQRVSVRGSGIPWPY